MLTSKAARGGGDSDRLCNCLRSGDEGAVRRDERGIALVVALVMIVLLGILGSLTLYTSSTELRITGNYRSSQDAFFVAEAGVEYAYADQAIYDAIIPGPKPANSWPAGGGLDDKQDVALGDFTAGVRVEWEVCGNLPIGTLASAEAGYTAGEKATKGNYYIVNVVGSGPDTGLSQPTQVAIESRHARLALGCL